MQHTLLHVAQLLAARQFCIGSAFATIGVTYALVVSKPFTKDEELIMDWVLDVDDMTLMAVVPLEDGSDMTVLRRNHVKQTLEEAAAEQVETMEKNFPIV